MEKKSLIGRLYCPMDNSYIERVDNGCEGALYGVWCEITSEPYTITLDDIVLGQHEEIMINVRSKESGIEYRVLWCESWLLNKWIPTEEDILKELDNKGTKKVC